MANQALYNNRVQVPNTVQIASGTSVTGTIQLSGQSLIGVILPPGWTAAALNIEVSPDGANWATAGTFDQYGSAVSSWASPVAGAAYAVDPLAMLPWEFVRFRSGSYASPINQTSTVSLVYITRVLD